MLTNSRKSKKISSRHIQHIKVRNGSKYHGKNGKQKTFKANPGTSILDTIINRSTTTFLIDIADYEKSNDTYKSIKSFANPDRIDKLKQLCSGTIFKNVAFDDSNVMIEQVICTMSQIQSIVNKIVNREKGNRANHDLTPESWYIKEENGELIVYATIEDTEPYFCWIPCCFLFELHENNADLYNAWIYFIYYISVVFGLDIWESMDSKYGYISDYINDIGREFANDLQEKISIKSEKEITTERLKDIISARIDLLQHYSEYYDYYHSFSIIPLQDIHNLVAMEELPEFKNFVDNKFQSWMKQKHKDHYTNQCKQLFTDTFSLIAKMKAKTSNLDIDNYSYDTTSDGAVTWYNGYKFIWNDNDAFKDIMQEDINERAGNFGTINAHYILKITKDHVFVENNAIVDDFPQLMCNIYNFVTENQYSKQLFINYEKRIKNERQQFKQRYPDITSNYLRQKLFAVLSQKRRAAATKSRNKLLRK